MQMTLSQEEARELHALLTSALADLRSEIHHTDSPEFRDHLQARQRVLTGMLDQLSPLAVR